MQNIAAGLSPGMVTLLVGILTFVAVFTGLYGVIYPVGGKSLTKRAGITSALNARRDVVNGEDKQKSIQQKLKEQEKRAKQAQNSLGSMIERAGYKVSPARYFVTFIAIAFGLAFFLLLFGAPPLVCLIAPLAFIALAPKWWLKRRITKKQKKFVEELPNAIDVLVRGVRTGLPIGDGMRLIAREIPEPVSTEFKLLTDSMSVGVTLEDALRRMYDRMPLAEINFFNIVLIIQKQTGGNLAEALGNLSVVIRERKKLRNKIKALSSEAKASAMIIGSLPFLLGCVLFAIAPDYISLLFTTSVGNMMVGGGLFWMGCGIFVMKQMIDIDI